MNRQYVKSICNGKVVFIARIYKLLTGRYCFETSMNKKPFEINMNMPIFENKEEAINWIEKNSEWKHK